MTRKMTVTDNLTGAVLADDSKPVKIVFDGKTYELDLSADSTQAMTAMLAGDGTEALARLLAPVTPAVKPTGRKRSASANGSETAAVRTWLTETAAGKALMTEHDYTPAASGRGKLPDWAREGYRKANGDSGGKPITPATSIPSAPGTVKTA